MRRRVGPMIAAQADRITSALSHCRIEDTRSTSLAMIVLAVERLEDEGRTAGEIRAFLEQVLVAPSYVDPRADTRGT